jgi:hypothetical protein
LSIVRNNTTGFVTIHRDSAISGSNDFPTVYFDKSLINNYTETQNSIRLNIPENEVYYFIPFEKDPNGGNIPLIIKEFKDFDCICCFTQNLDTPPSCSKLKNVSGSIISWGCRTFENCYECGFIPNGTNQSLNAGVVLKATTIVYN